MKLDFDTVIPGHGPIAKKADMLTYRNNVEKLRTEVTGMIRQNKSRDEIAKVDRGSSTDGRPPACNSSAASTGCSPSCAASTSTCRFDIVSRMSRTFLVRLSAVTIALGCAWIAYTQAPPAEGQKQAKQPNNTMSKVADDLYAIIGDGGNSTVWSPTKA